MFQHKNSLLIVWCILLTGLFLCPVGPVQAESYAATVTVFHDGVTIKRAQTSVWLPVASGSVLPLGSGDQIQTDLTGRTLITFWNGAQTLVLPRSTFRIHTLAHNADTGYDLAIDVEGTAVHHMDSPDTALNYHLALPGLVVTDPAAVFATWSRGDGPNTVLVAEGSAQVSTMDQTINLSSGQGIYSNAIGFDVVSLESPLNEARLIGVLEGCPGMVDTVDAVELRVRAGPGLGYVVQGAYHDAQTVQLMATNESAGWYRVQFLSGFGWLRKTAVETTCEDLPVLQDTVTEDPLYIIDATTDELDWLQIFFDVPVRNTWFYQWTIINIE